MPPDNTWYYHMEETMIPGEVNPEIMERNRRFLENIVTEYTAYTDAPYETFDAVESSSYAPVTRRRSEVCMNCRQSYDRSYRMFNIQEELVCPGCHVPWNYCNACDTKLLMSELNEVQLQGYTYNICGPCYENRVFHCTRCNEQFMSHVSRNTSMCSNCYNETHVSCVECARSLRIDTATVSRELGGFACSSCRSMMPSTVRTSIAGGFSREMLPFGIEIETEFSGSSPFMLHGYHYREQAGMPFLTRWRAETDASLTNGGEFISPPLTEPSAIAEVFYTIDKLVEANAYMDNTCGQHITVAVGNSEPGYASRVQLLTMILEEALFAVNGQFERGLRNDYCVRLKESFEIQNLIRDKQVIPERRVPAYVKRDSIEFRYPPGTFSHQQVMMNIGLTQLIMKAAAELDPSDIDAISLRSLYPFGQYGSSRGTAENMHQRTLVGLEVINDFGWKKGGRFTGLPYDPNINTSVGVLDESRRISESYNLPTADSILNKMLENLSIFYYDGLDRGFNTDMYDEAYNTLTEA